MEPSDALFNIVEASLALAGFAGIVSALGQRSTGRWRPEDRDRVVQLLLATLFPFVSALLALTLLYAGVQSVWRVSSMIVALTVLVGAAITGRRIRRLRDAPDFSISALYVASVYLALAIVAALQFANLRLDSFWPYFAGLAVSLCLGVSQFVRLLWFGIQGARAA